MSDEQPWLTAAQAAQRLQVSVKTIRRWVAAGDLRAYRFGSTSLRFRAADLDLVGEATPLRGGQR